MKTTVSIIPERVLRPVSIGQMSPAQYHFNVRVFTTNWTWIAMWAPDADGNPPAEAEVIAAWREDTNSGRRQSKNWERM